MAEILERGSKLVDQCKYCGCIFSYTEEETKNSNVPIADTGKYRIIQTIICPQCGMQIPIKRGDCTLVEIGTCKDCKRYNKNEMLCTWTWNNGKISMQKCDPDYYCKDFEKRGDSDGSN